MTPNPECATLETTILDALHIMHDGKFLHLPVVDKGEHYLLHAMHFFHDEIFNIICWADGGIAACVDVLQITHAAISMVIHLFLMLQLFGNDMHFFVAFHSFLSL